MTTLKGLRVLNTRPSKQGTALSQSIRAAGGLPIDLPALLIEPTPNEWLTHLPPLASIKHALFISANAVDYFFAHLKRSINAPWPNSIQVIAMGEATAAALDKHGIPVHQVPTISDSEHLLTLDALQQIRDKTVLLVKGIGGRTLITETLRARGAHLISLDVYQSRPPQFNRAEINSLWQDDAVDIILFTSEQAMQHILAAFVGKGLSWLRNKPCLVISERLAKAAALFGIKTIILSHHDAILTDLKGFNHDKQRRNKDHQTKT